MNKNGFIATSLIYSFFLIFITLFLSIIADHLQNKVLLSTIEREIKEEITNTISINDFKVGDIIYFELTNFSDLKCGTDLATWNTCTTTELDTEKEYKVSSFEVYNDEKIDTIKLFSGATDYIYIYHESMKFSFKKDFTGNGIVITEVLS